MATTTYFDTASRPALRARLAAWFSAYIDRLSRREAVEALQAKSDAELAAMGLTRDRIVQHVFRDRLTG